MFCVIFLFQEVVTEVVAEVVMDVVLEVVVVVLEVHEAGVMETEVADLIVLMAAETGEINGMAIIAV